MKNASYDCFISRLLVMVLTLLFAVCACTDSQTISDEPSLLPPAPTVYEAADIADGKVVLIRNKETGRALNMQLSGMMERSRVWQYGKTGMLDELWRVHVSGEYVSFENLFIPRYVSRRDEGITEGTVIDVALPGELESHLWRLVCVGDAYMLIPNGGDGSLILGLPNDDRSSDNLPTLVENNGENTSLWVFEEVTLQNELPYMLPVDGNIYHSSCPQMIKHGDTYYLVAQAPNISIKASSDMVNWDIVGKVFPGGDPSWLDKEVPGYGIWAPSVYKIGDKYYVYYSVSTIGSQNSAIGVAVNETLDSSSAKYRWVDLGMVIRSYTGSDYNCIDPNIFIEENGEVWLTFGSYWNGIFQMRINPETGLLMYPADSDENVVHHIARRTVSYGAIEAPYIIKKDGYYYLFTAFNPMDLSYHNRVGRSESLHGPFIDRKGNDMMSGGGTEFTKGSYELQLPGHGSIFKDDDGQYYFVGEYFRDFLEGGSPSILMISTIVWDNEGWPISALTPDAVKRLTMEQ